MLEIPDVEVLTGPSLDAMVALADGWEQDPKVLQQWHHAVRGTFLTFDQLRFAQEWALAGPIIESRHITLICGERNWLAEVGGTGLTFASHIFRDRNPLVAAMRAFVASRFVPTPQD